MLYVFFAVNGKIMYKGHHSSKVLELAHRWPVFVYWVGVKGLIQLDPKTLTPLKEVVTALADTPTVCSTNSVDGASHNT